MSKVKAPESWDNLKKDCELAHNCSEFQLRYSISRRDRKAQRKIEKDRVQINSVMNAAKEALSNNPNQTPEELTKSIIAILAPWILQWLISAFQKQVIDWLIGKLKVDT